MASEKTISNSTPKFEYGGHTFAEHLVAMKNLTGPNIRLHFMRHNSVVIDTTHGLIHFSHFTLQVKSTASETSAKPQVVRNLGSTTDGDKNDHSIF